MRLKVYQRFLLSFVILNFLGFGTLYAKTCQDLFFLPVEKVSTKISSLLSSRFDDIGTSRRSLDSNTLLDLAHNFDGFMLNLKFEGSRDSVYQSHEVLQALFFIESLRYFYQGDFPWRFWKENYVRDPAVSVKDVNEFVDRVLGEYPQFEHFFTGSLRENILEDWYRYGHFHYRQGEWLSEKPHFRIPFYINMHFADKHYSVVDSHMTGGNIIIGKNDPNSSWPVDSAYLDFVFSIYSERLGLRPEQIENLRRTYRFDESVLVLQRDANDSFSYISGFVLMLSESFKTQLPVEILHDFRVREVLGWASDAQVVEVGRHVRVEGDLKDEFFIMKMVMTVISSNFQSKYVVVEVDEGRMRLWQKFGFQSVVMPKKNSGPDYYKSGTDFLMYAEVDTLMKYFFPNTQGL